MKKKTEEKVSKEKNLKKAKEKRGKKSSVQQHRLTQWRLTKHIIRLFSFFAVNQATMAIPFRQRWNLALNDSLSFNLTQVAPKGLKTATLIPANKYFKIEKRPVNGSPQPNNYISLSVSLSSLNLKVDPTTCTISRSIPMGEGLLHLFMICRESDQKTSLLILKVNRTELERSDMVKVLMNSDLSGPSPPDKGYGFKKVGATCYSIYQLKELNLFVVSCMLQYTDYSTRGYHHEIPYIYIFMWNQKTQKYFNNFWFYSRYMDIDVEARVKFDDQRLRWNIGLVGSPPGVGSDDPVKLHLYSPRNFILANKNLGSYLCYKFLYLNLKTMVITNGPDGDKVQCMTPITNFYEGGDLLSRRRRRRRRNLQSKANKLTTNVVPEKAKNKKIENLRKLARKRFLLGDNNLEVYLKKTFFLNIGTEKAPDYAVALVAVIANSDPTKSILVVCIVDTQKTTVPSTLKCSKMAKRVPSALKFTLEDWYASEVYFFKDENNLFKLLLIHEKTLNIYQAEFITSKLISQNDKTFDSIQVTSTKPLIQRQKDLILLKWFVHVDPDGEPTLKQYNNRIKAVCYFYPNDPANIKCSNMAYINLAVFYAGPKSVMGTITQRGSEPPWMKIEAYQPEKPSEPTKPVLYDFWLNYEGGDAGYKTLPYEANLTLVGGNGVTFNFPMVFSRNASLGFSKKRRDYTILKGNMASVGFSDEDVIGEFVKVSAPTLGAYDNKMEIQKIIFNNSASKVPIKIPKEMYLKYIYHMNSFGYIGLFLVDSTDPKRNQTFIFLKCTSVGNIANFTSCQSLSQFTFGHQEVIYVYDLFVFGGYLVLIQCYTKKTIGSTTKNMGMLRVVDLRTGEDLNAEEMPNQAVFGLPADYSQASNIKINCSISSYQMEMSLVFKSSVLKTSTQGVYTRFFFNPVNKTFNPIQKLVVKSFDPKVEILDFDVYRSNHGTLFRVVKYNEPSEEDPGEYRQFMYRDGALLIGETLQISYAKKIEMNQTYSYCSTFNKLFVYPGIGTENPGPYSMIFEKNPKISYKYYLNLKSESSILALFQCFSHINMVQVLIRDEVQKKKWLVNYLLDDYDFRRRYHSWIEVDYSTQNLYTYTSDNGRYIQTLLVSSKPDLQNLNMALTRVDSFQVKFNTSNLSGMKESIKLVGEDNNAKQASTVVDINFIEPLKQQIDFVPKIIKKESIWGDNVPQKDLIHLGQKIDIDSYFKIQGLIASVELISTLTGLKNGVDYNFTSRKHTVGGLSVKKILPNEQKKQQNLQKVEKIGKGLTTIYGKIQPKKDLNQIKMTTGSGLKDTLISSLFGILVSIKMTRLRTMGDWLVMQMKFKAQPPYLQLIYHPEKFGQQRDDSKDMKIRSLLVTKTQLLKIISFRLSIDRFYSTENRSQVLLSVQRELYDVKVGLSAFYMQVYRSQPQSSQKGKETPLS